MLGILSSRKVLKLLLLIWVCSDLIDPIFRIFTAAVLVSGFKVNHVSLLKLHLTARAYLGLVPSELNR